LTVARDRQRAKQRRRRSGGAGGPAGGSARTRARDAAREQEAARAPEPTEHAFPDVEEAEMAEAGVPLPDADEAAPEPAPDEQSLDPALVEERAEAARPRRKRGKVLTFLGHVIDELRRVQWPDRRQTGQGTAVTLGFVVVAGGFLGLMDAIWKPLVEAIL
jgi:preprotein translocase SecE subunit